MESRLVESWKPEIDPKQKECGRELLSQKGNEPLPIGIEHAHLLLEKSIIPENY